MVVPGYNQPMTATERAALSDALAAASVGPTPPPMNRLLAAAEYVIDRARPDQVILFGSASRGEFRADSDFDFLVVRRPGVGTPTTDAEKWTHPETGDAMDVLFESPDLARERRWRLGTPESVIFAEGATVHTAPGATAVRTLRDDGRTRDDMTSTKYRWDPSEATELVEDARLYLGFADTAADQERWGTACKQVQESAERALKAVVVAANTEFSGIHDLGQLWTTVCDADGDMPFKRDSRALTRISRYAGDAGYADRFRKEDPEDLFRDFRPTAGKLVEYAEFRVRERLARMRGRVPAGARRARARRRRARPAGRSWSRPWCSAG